MRFKGLDLNLLVAFAALMETRSVSRAAERLNMSQPAMSAALGRLRAFFDDELLIARGKRMHPSAFAEGILPQVEEALRTLESMMATPTEFDPATSQRVFRICASDYVVASVLRPLVAAIAEEAPAVKLDIILPSEDALAQLDQGKIDLMVTPEYVVSSDHPSELLYEERQVVVGWSRNPLMLGDMTEDDFFASGHVAVAVGSTRTASFADRQLEISGRKRRIEVIAPFFTAVPWLLEGTMRLAIMHERLFGALEGRFELAAREIPFAMPEMRQMVFYHEAREGDAGLAWLRSKLSRSIVSFSHRLDG
jgi:LysR family transcriptional regulator, nod-box dependent transcriptional activator